MLFKKIRKLALILMVLLLSACTGQNETPDPENTPEPSESNLIELTSQQLKEKEPDCDYFVLLVYTQDCVDCLSFTGILEKYLKINKLKFYSITDEEFLKADSIAAEYIEKTPFLAVYSKGKVLSYLDFQNPENQKYYSSVAGFTGWMKDKTEEYCLKPEEKSGSYCMSNSGC